MYESTSLPPIVIGLGALIGLIALSGAAGRRLLRWLRVPYEPGIEAITLACGLGLGALQAVPFALFALGIGYTGAFRVALALLALLLAPDLLAGARALLRALRGIGGWPAAEKLLFAAFSLLLLYMLPRAVLPITDDDGLLYHLAASVRYLQAHRFIYLPTLTFTNWPVGVEMLMALALGAQRAIPPGIVTYLFGALGLPTVWLLAKRIAGPKAAVLATALAVVYPVYWTEMGSALIDVGGMLFGALGIYTLLRAATAEDDGTAWVRLCGLFGGLAATTKLTNYGVPIALAVAYAFSDLVPNRGRRARQACSILVISAAVIVPWLARTWALTGNPVYPVLYGLFGGREWTDTGMARLQECHLLFNRPPNMPPTHTVLTAVHALLTLVGALCAAAVWRFYRRGPAGLVARYAGLFTAYLCATSYFNARFLLPAFAAYLAAAACSAVARKPAHAIAWVVAVLSAVKIGGAVSKDPPIRQAVRVAFGAESRDAYMASRLPEWPLVRYVNAHAAPDARVLVCGYGERTAMLRPMTYTSDYWRQDCFHGDDAGRLVSELRAHQVTYLLLEQLDEEWCVKSYVCGPRISHEAEPLAAVAAGYGSLLGSAGGFTLYRLDLPTP